MRPAVIAVAIGAVALAHLLTPPDHYLLHNAYQRLYYVPILLAAVWYGLRGGLLAAVACMASYTPHILLQWEGDRAYQVSQLVEMAMFAVIGTLAGALADRERRLRRHAEQTAAERDRALRNLEETVETLRRADRLATLGTLTAGMAHEIRNPLAALGGAVEIIARDYPTEHPRREFVEILQREVERLSAVASKYLELARPQAPALRPVEVAGALRRAVELVAKSAQRTGVRTHVAEPGAGLTVLADPGQLHQVLVNLLVNGIQAMPSGGLLEVAAGGGDGVVEIIVRDHGEGLPAESSERIFEPFYTTRRGGTGLGLAVSRQIVTAHDGTLRAANAEGEGAVFTLTLPQGPGTMAGGAA